MKLLLTSGGLTNPSIIAALFDLAGKKPEETTLIFIPTAMNATEGGKEWYIDDLYRLKQQNFKCIDIVDISALPKQIWLPRLEAGDVLLFSGGLTEHLMYSLKDSGLAELLSKLLETRVYAGISAGSIVTGPSLAMSNGKKRTQYKEQTGYDSRDALGFVDFYIRPHLNAPKHPHSRADKVEELAKDVDGVVYALDDQSALKVVEGHAEVITEGEYLIFNS